MKKLLLILTILPQISLAESALEDMSPKEKAVDCVETITALKVLLQESRKDVHFRSGVFQSEKVAKRDTDAEFVGIGKRLKELETAPDTEATRQERKELENRKVALLRIMEAADPRYGILFVDKKNAERVHKEDIPNLFEAFLGRCRNPEVKPAIEALDESTIKVEAIKKKIKDYEISYKVPEHLRLSSKSSPAKVKEIDNKIKSMIRSAKTYILKPERPNHPFTDSSEQGSAAQ